MTTSGTKALTAHVPRMLAEKIDLMAARINRSRGWIVKQALTAWIELEPRNLAKSPGQIYIKLNVYQSWRKICKYPNGAIA